MNTCKDCKHWGKEAAPGDDLTPFRECTNEKLNSNPNSDGFDVDCDKWFASYSGPDFGCIHWEEKPK